MFLARDDRTQTFFGRQKKSIHVVSNDPEAKETDLVLTLDVAAGILLVPAYFAFPPALRRAVYTTNQIESLNSVVRKAVRVRGHFPDDESARKLVYLAIRNHESNWKRPMAGWYECLAAFHAHFQDRLTRQS